MKLTEAKYKALLREAFSSIGAARCFAQFAPYSGILPADNIDDIFMERMKEIGHGEGTKFYNEVVADYIQLAMPDKIILFQALAAEYVAMILFERAQNDNKNEFDYLEARRQLAPHMVSRQDVAETIEYAPGEVPHYKDIEKCLEDLKSNRASDGFNEPRAWYEDAKLRINSRRDDATGGLKKRKNLPKSYRPPAADDTAVLMKEIKRMIKEELTKTDKAEIKRMISSELDKSLKKELKKALEDELSKALNSKTTKEEIAEITKKVMKKLYKDLSFHHPYIIDRIKV